MGDYYHLTCYDCREELCLGKAVLRDEEGRSFPRQFEAFIPGSHWVGGEDPAPIVGRFLLLHRGHEIRVMTDPFPELLYSDLDSVFRYVGDEISFKDYVNGPVEPEPDTEAEWQSFPTAEAERLWRKLHAPWSLESTLEDGRRGFTARDVERLERQYLAAAPSPTKLAK